MAKKEKVEKIETVKMSVSGYAKSIGKHRQTVLAQIWGGRLPEGIKVEKVGKTYMVSVPKES